MDSNFKKCVKALMKEVFTLERLEHEAQKTGYKDLDNQIAEAAKETMEETREMPPLKFQAQVRYFTVKTEVLAQAIPQIESALKKQFCVDFDFDDDFGDDDEEFS